MSPAPAWELSYPPTTQQAHQHEYDEDTKAPFDDLIDQYALPYSQNSQHKSYTMDPAVFGAGDRTHNSTGERRGKDLEEASSQGHDWAYPPTAALEEKSKSGKKALTWSTVRVLSKFP